MVRRVRALAPALLAAFLLACGGQTETDREVELVEGSPSEPGFPEASLQIETPEPGASYEEGTVEARLSLEGFELGASTPGLEDRGLAFSENGQHVHFIVDNEPYRALYDLGDPVEVSGLDPGRHVLRAFASRQWHESVKSDGAFAATWFTVGDDGEVEAWDPEAPLLTYSRPKGTYAGADADSVMVDFYLSNAEIGPGDDQHSVRLTVDDSLSWTLTEWAPHYVLGLDEGDHTFRLELLAPDGTVVPGPFNSTERVITVESDDGGG